MTPSDMEIIAIEFDDHFFLAPNHGGLSLIRPDLNISNAVQIELKNRPELIESESQIAVTAVHLLNKGRFETIGKPLSHFKKLQTIHPEIRNENTAIVHVQYIDHFGQLVTNANEDWLKKWSKEREFVAIARGRKIKNWISSREEMTETGSLYLKINRAGFLEIGIIEPGLGGSNSAASLLGIVIHDPIELQIK
jgi:S-adenosylmethionine hydrolase